MRPYALGYVLFEDSPEGIAKWHSFATEVLGLMRGTDVGKAVRYRMDERIARFIIVPGTPRNFTLGWEYPGEAAFRQALADLRETGVELTPVDKAGLTMRGVTEAYQFVDPIGVRSELFYGGHVEPIVPFVSPTGARFVTGDQGMGHATLLVDDVAKAKKFYLGPMGMHLRETTFLNAAFFGVNPRQHSFAAVQVPMEGSGAQLSHVMLEVEEVDDVGRALDKCVGGKAPLTTSLGKHWNDHMISFYVRTPSGWDVEFGAGGLRVEQVGDWSQVHQGGLAGASLWGHHLIGPNGEIGRNIGVPPG
ncbi:MAG: VOC family protein [Candidatus Eremiobacteraeota bacterium]|nr:VOC family protein [Candidatus Eremiobacteraeota bacterium]